MASPAISLRWCSQLASKASEDRGWSVEGQLCQFQDQVVRRVGLVAGIGVPRIPDVGWPVLPEVFGRVGSFVRRDHVDIEIFVLVEVGKRVNV